MEKIEFNRRNNLNRKDFDSKWEYTKAVSRWHFDPECKEADDFKVFLRVDGDWKKDVEKLKFEIAVGTRNYGHQGTDHDEIIEKDYMDWGYKPEMIQYERTYDIPNSLQKVADVLKLKDADVRVHRQMPGQVAPIHIDTYCSHPETGADPSLDMENMRRFVIQLTDWHWGHFWNFGNTPWSQWKAGEAVFFESRDLIHCTANAGMIPRVTMIVTGWLTDETWKLVGQDYTVVEI